MKIRPKPGRKMSEWQLIFSQSKVNGGTYNGDALERYIWQWPEGTYFQRRLSRMKSLKSTEHISSDRRSRVPQ